MAQKYEVVKLSELRRLDPELQSMFAEVMTAIAEKRGDVPPDDYCVFNLKDKYTEGALDGYIRAVEADPTNARNPGVVDAVTHVRGKKRDVAFRSTPTRLPTGG